MADEAVKTEVTPEVTPAAAPEVAPEAAPLPATPPAEPPRPRAQQLIEKMMQQTRDTRERQVLEKQRQEAIELAQRIQMARQLGPDAVLAAAGVEKPKFDISKLLDPDEDTEPKSVKELKSQVAQLDQYIKSLQQEREQEKQGHQQQQMQLAQKQELENIGRFIQSGKDKYQYVARTLEIGSDKDLYNGMVSMYNQGYSPSHEDMADLVEARIEQVLDLLKDTPKFQAWVQDSYGVQLNAKRADSPTLTSSLTAESPATVDPSKMTDEENRRYALQKAMEVREGLLKGLKK